MSHANVRFGCALLLVFMTVATEPSAAGKVGHVAIIERPTPGVMLRATQASGWEPVTAETKILQGGTLKTGAQTSIVTLVDGTVLEVLPASNLQFHASTEINLDPGPPTRVARVDIKEGSFRVLIPAAGRSLLAMASKDIFVAFRPGKGRVKVTSDGLVAVVDEGSAKVAAAGKWTALAAGQYQLLKFRGAQPGPKALPPTPIFDPDACHATPSTPCAIGVVVGDGQTPLRIRWKTAAPAHHYQVDIMRHQITGEVIKSEEVSGDASQYQTDPLPVGAYFIGLRAFSAEGIEGTRVTRRMQVIRLLPDLGVTWLPKDRVLVFPPGRKVRLDAVQGAQLSWFPPDFVPLPSVLELTGDMTRTIRLRVEGDSTDETSIIMERSALRAEVELSPTRANWPRDTIHIAVKLADPRRRVDPANVRPRLRVKINESLVQVGMTKVGDSWRAAIAPRNGKGPWAIRVEALDADDNVLGRGLLNVVGQESKSRGIW